MGMDPLQFHELERRCKENSQRRTNVFRTLKFPDVPLETERIVRECQLHCKIIEFCKYLGWIYFHGSTAHRTKRTIGEPDFTILADGGITFFIECKKPGGKISKDQNETIHHAARLGHTIHVVESYEEFLSVMRDAQFV